MNLSLEQLKRSKSELVNKEKYMFVKKKLRRRISMSNISLILSFSLSCTAVTSDNTIPPLH